MKFGPKEILAILLALGGLGTAGLTIGAFASTNPDAIVPGLFLLKPIESLVSQIPPFAWINAGSNDNTAFSRGFAYMGLAILLTSVAAMLVSPTRAETVPVPGRKEA